MYPVWTPALAARLHAPGTATRVPRMNSVLSGAKRARSFLRDRRNQLRGELKVSYGKAQRLGRIIRSSSGGSLSETLAAIGRKTSRHADIFAPRYGLRTLDDPDEGSLSGPGSTVERTEAIRETLPKLLKELDCQVFIDAPCGDLKWMQHVELPVERYIGVDVIGELIESNQKQFANEQRSFLHLDLVQQALPKADLVLNRDMLIHLSFEDIAKFVALLKQSGCRYLLTSHFPDQTDNSDIRTGDWRPVNLEIAPFHFPAPSQILDERYTQNKQHSDKCLALWEIAKLPDFDPTAT